MAQLWDLGLRGTALDVVAAWKEALLLVALAVVAWHVRTSAGRQRRGCPRPRLRDRHRRLLARSPGRARGRGDDPRRAARAPPPSLPGRGVRARPARLDRVDGARPTRRADRADRSRRRGRRPPRPRAHLAAGLAGLRCSRLVSASSSGSSTRGCRGFPRTGSTTPGTRRTPSDGSSRPSSLRWRAPTSSSSR